jgi:serine/threonine-protein kinase
MSSTPFLSRHFGDYLLVAQLSEDALGSVYRALYLADERRFVRLRILQTPEISREVLVATIEEGEGEPALEHDAIVRRAELSVADGMPYMVWYENAGWTLDQLLAAVRGLGVRIPVEYALLIAERIAAGLEHALLVDPAGRLRIHGLLWPGFVSISHDAQVRVGGFGIHDALLPRLNEPRLAREVAPYIAPETRAMTQAVPSSDAYSLGMILHELLTGRRPTTDTPYAELRAGEELPDEVVALLVRALATEEDRFPSIVEMHRSLQTLVTANPHAYFASNLALFIYKLLNPEGQQLVVETDGESTNPIPDLEAPFVEAEPKRRRTDSSVELRRPPVPAPAFPDALVPATVSAVVAPTPPAVKESAPWTPPLRRGRWVPGAADFLVAGAAIAVAIALGLRQASTPTPVAPPLVAAVPGAVAELPALRPSAAEQIAVAVPPAEVVRPEVVSPRRGPGARKGALLAPANARPKTERESRDAALAADSARFRAGLARIEADRIDANRLAAAIYVQGQAQEGQGENSLRSGEFESAARHLNAAERLYRQAEEFAKAERVRLVSMAAAR